jgi:hypothetical protein
MSTLGIDLAAQPQNTAACLLNRDGAGRVRVVHLARGIDDHDLLGLMTAPGLSRIGIDAPFGWPIGFLDAVHEYHVNGAWPDPPGDDAHQRQMRFRATDHAVIDVVGITPLSVSTDRIAIVAMRCARLLSAYWRVSGQRPDRSGRGTIVEVYPAAALRVWGLGQHDHPQDPGSYRGSTPGARRRRARIMRSILRQGTGWLELSDDLVEGCVAIDHLLDALLSALVALAADLGKVPEAAPPPVAAAEGWTALPTSPLWQLGSSLALPELAEQEHEPEHLIPPGGYLEIDMPEQFELGIQDKVGGSWGTWATGLRREWFVRRDDGSYVCTAHGGSPIYFRALSIDDRGVFEHVDGDGYGHVYRYRLRAEPPGSRA